MQTIEEMRSTRQGLLDAIEDVNRQLEQINEKDGKATSDGRLSFSGDASGSNGIITFLQLFKHFRQKRGRILQIHIHDNHIFSFRMLKSSVHGSFFSEISGE